MYIIKKQRKKVKTNIELAKFEKSSSINLKYLKADNSFQYFAKKKASDRMLLILLGDKCLTEIFKSLSELFQALIVFTIELFPLVLVL